MEPTQTQQAQPIEHLTPPPTFSPIQDMPQKPSQLPVILLSLLSFIFLSGMIYFYLQTKSLQQEKSVETTPITTPTTSPISSPSISPTTVSTTQWKLYSNPDLSFKYPNSWTVGQGNTALVSDIAGAGATVFTKDTPMYNECMKLVKTETKNNVMVKYYTYANEGEMCGGQTGSNLSNKEVWITKSGGDGYQPGIIYSYNTSIYPESESIINQIISTFKFSD